MKGLIPNGFRRSDSECNVFIEIALSFKLSLEFNGYSPFGLILYTYRRSQT